MGRALAGVQAHLITKGFSPGVGSALWLFCTSASTYQLSLSLDMLGERQPVRGSQSEAAWKLPNRKAMYVLLRIVS